MHWFFITLISPISHAAVNFLDKYLISHYAEGDDSPSVGSLALFSSLFAIVVLPILLLFGIPGSIPPATEMWLLMLTGAIYLGAIIFYLYALLGDDVSNVVPFWLTAPVFDFFLGWMYLGEKLTLVHILASLLILFGASILSLIRDEQGKIRVKWQLALLMLGSSALFAINDVLFKKIALTSGFWDSTFFTYVGYLLLGVILFFVVKTYRNGFLSLLRKNGRFIFGINVLGETLMVGGDVAVRFATLIAPLALVETVSDAFQPLIVFVGGLVLTLLLPRFVKESVEKKDVVQKIVAITIMVVGTILLLLY